MKEKPEIICELTVAGVDMETLQPEHSLTDNNSTLFSVHCKIVLHVCYLSISVVFVCLGAFCSKP